MSKTTIFGFGSLLSTESLRATAPNASDITPCYIKGFIRDFSLWDPGEFKTTNPDMTVRPYCALDVKPSDNPEARVNGISFTVSDADLKALQEREREYQLIKTTSYNLEDQQALGTCLVFSANKNSGSYDFGSAEQLRYLQVCLDGARERGEGFYIEFLRTTYIGEKNLEELLPQLLAPETTADVSTYAG